MEMKTLILLTLLTGCTTTFDTRPVNDVSTITWVRYIDPFVLDARCREITKISIFAEINGCAEFDLVNKTCKIHTMNPKSENDGILHRMGHEMKHCFDGDFHK
jgi:hypothetical protein